MSDTEFGKVPEESKYLQEPENDYNHHYTVQYPLDLALHGDEAVDQPKEHADDNKCENYSDKWHILPRAEWGRLR